MEKNNFYEAIFVIVNKSFTDVVISSAQANGAKGGTVIDAKESSKNHSSFFSKEANANKEIVMIVVNRRIKNKVIKGVYEVAGLSTLGDATVFALPVSSVVGINKPLK